MIQRVRLKRIEHLKRQAAIASLNAERWLVYQKQCLQEAADLAGEGASRYATLRQLRESSKVEMLTVA
jgi:hypothetical protein